MPSFLPKKYSEYLGLGVEIAASIAVPVLGGYFADVFFNTFPWLTLSGIALALILFVMTAIRISNKLNEKNDN